MFFKYKKINELLNCNKCDFHCTNKSTRFLMENNFAILRTEKLKTFGNIGGSLAHNFRDIETPNADADRTIKNSHSLKSSDEVMNAIQLRLPEKRRSDAVLCIEHLITASPTWDGWGTEREHEFFENSKKWLEKQYGSKNVVAVSIHRDETTPHMIAYVVPVDDATGKLNAKKWLGGRAKMSQMQSDFADQVRSLGLERGIEGSKAKTPKLKNIMQKLIRMTWKYSEMYIYLMLSMMKINTCMLKDALNLY